MAFFQTPPSLGNQFDDDRVLRAHLSRTLTPDVLDELTPQLREMGHLAGGELYAQQLADRLIEPQLIPYDPWGNRVDHIEVSPLWKRAAKLAAEHGVVARGYETALGRAARVVQFSLVYLFNSSTDIYSCPLAMTDGAARTLLTHKPAGIVERAVPRLLSRDPDTMWTSGQWMTERTGGSDVGISETIAKRDGDQFRLHGTKWFTSATTSQMALTLARPEGNPAGGRGLALFYLENVGEDGRRNGILVNRLKDKLGTRKVPTAELTLDGTLAIPVVGLGDGVKAIAPMLNVTRTWNAICAVGAMRRVIALARDYSKKRVAFGAPLSEKPLHAQTLAGLQAEFEAMFGLAFFGVELLAAVESGEPTDRETLLCRLATPIIKATTAKAAVAVTSEGIEAFGGAGYVEDTGLPTVLRDAQVLPIWEGTTNVLSLDTLRAVGDGEAVRVWHAEIVRAAATASDSDLVRAGKIAVSASDHALRFLLETAPLGREAVESGARGVTLSLGRAMALARLVEAASVALKTSGDARPKAAALRFARSAIDHVQTIALEDDRALANDA